MIIIIITKLILITLLKIIIIIIIIRRRRRIITILKITIITIITILKIKIIIVIAIIILLITILTHYYYYYYCDYYYCWYCYWYCNCISDGISPGELLWRYAYVPQESVKAAQQYHINNNNSNDKNNTTKNDNYNENNNNDNNNNDNNNNNAVFLNLRKYNNNNNNNDNKVRIQYSNAVESYDSVFKVRIQGIPSAALLETIRTTFIYNDNNNFARRFWMMIISHTLVQRQQTGKWFYRTLIQMSGFYAHTVLGFIQTSQKKQDRYVHRPRQGLIFTFNSSAAAPESF